MDEREVAKRHRQGRFMCLRLGRGQLALEQKGLCAFLLRLVQLAQLAVDSRKIVQGPGDIGKKGIGIVCR